METLHIVNIGGVALLSTVFAFYWIATNTVEKSGDSEWGWIAFCAITALLIGVSVFMMFV